MTPSARVQAAIEILDGVIAAARDEGAAADVLIQRFFKERRYAGSKDRKAIRELVFRAIRLCGERPESGRAAMLALAAADPQLAALFDNSAYGPASIAPDEVPAPTKLFPDWMTPEISPVIAPDELPALVDRAPLDLRVNVARTSRDVMLREFPSGQPTSLSPWGIRLPNDSPVSDHWAYGEGLIEIQDEGSQLVALACAEHPGELIIDLCAGAGGKTLALDAAVGGQVDILACDTNRARLERLEPRAQRAGATIATRLIDPGQEAAELSDFANRADCVLVDAPCSGSGTWRRNPEARWRLSDKRLQRLLTLQEHLLDVAATQIRPGGVLVYAVCSILRREGAGQVERFLERHPWVAEDICPPFGRSEGNGRLLSPGRDGTDGLFIARLGRPC